MATGFFLINCGAIPNNSTSTNGSSSSSGGSTPTSQSLAAGEILYSDNCATCHGSLSSSDVAGVTADLIQTGIDNNAGGMAQFAGLTSDEVQSIADALNQDAVMNSGTTGGSSDDDNDGDVENEDDDGDSDLVYGSAIDDSDEGSDTYMIDDSLQDTDL